MADNPLPNSDHDSLVTLVETVKNLKDSQDKFHQDIKDSISELKDNYASRLNVVETELRVADKTFTEKTSQDKLNDTFDSRLTTQEQWRWYMVGAIAIIGFALIFYATYYPHK